MYHLIPPNIHNDHVEVIARLQSVAKFCTNGLASLVENGGAATEDATGFYMIMTAVTDGMQELHDRMHAEKTKRRGSQACDDQTYPRTGTAG